MLIWIDRKGWLRPGRLVLVYVAGYTFARFFIEGLRIDNANKIAGLRVNEWVSAVVFLVAVRGWRSTAGAPRRAPRGGRALAPRGRRRGRGDDARRRGCRRIRQG